MLRNFFYNCLGLLGRITGRVIIALPAGRLYAGRSAVLASAGFWYVGNIADTGDIAYGILCNGEIETEGTKLVVRILNIITAENFNLVFYDAGANTGYFGLLAAFLGRGKIQTYAFEPVSEFADMALQSAALNRLEGLVKVFNLALGDEDKPVQISLSGTGTTLVPGFLGSAKAEKRSVIQRKLDSIVLEQRLLPPDFLKIDVEGFERQVLEGGRDLLEKFKPVVWYESARAVKSNNFINRDFLATQNFLRGLGYEIYTFSGRGLNLAVPADKVADGVDMYLALHAARHQNILTELNKA